MAAAVDEAAQTIPTVSPFDPAVRDDAASHSLNRIRAGKDLQITADRRIGNMELMRQIVAGIVPSYAQHFQQLLPTLSWGHAVAPLPSLSGANDKR